MNREYSFEHLLLAEVSSRPLAKPISKSSSYWLAEPAERYLIVNFSASRRKIEAKAFHVVMRVHASRSFLLQKSLVNSRRRCFRMSAHSTKMPKRHLGKTGMEVSVMGFGASPLGGIFRVGLADSSLADHRC